jgi:hemerythrin-like domain-containing protein
MKSTEQLMADHEIILEALRILEAICDQIEGGEAIEKSDICSLLTFLRDFADGAHHVKEEAILFPALLEAGMTMHEEPLRVIAYEHERGRALIAAMDEALGRDNNYDFVVYARRYIKLLTQHICKENDVFFGMADQKLTDDQDQEIAEAFEQFEQNIVGSSAYRRLKQTISDLARKYLGVAVIPLFL